MHHLEILRSLSWNCRRQLEVYIGGILTENRLKTESTRITFLRYSAFLDAM